MWRRLGLDEAQRKARSVFSFSAIADPQPEARHVFIELDMFAFALRHLESGNSGLSELHSGCLSREDLGKFAIVFPCIPESILAFSDQRVQRRMFWHTALLSTRVFPSVFGPSVYESGGQRFESVRARHLKSLKTLDLLCLPSLECYLGFRVK